MPQAYHRHHLAGPYPLQRHIGPHQDPQQVFTAEPETPAQLGHVRRMEDGRLPKDNLYGHLTSGVRPVGRPALKFKDGSKRDTKTCAMSPTGWETVAEDRTALRQATRRCIERADEKKHQHAAEKRMRLKKKAALPPLSSCFVCFGCGKDCHCRIGIHSRSGRCQNSTS